MEKFCWDALKRDYHFFIYWYFNCKAFTEGDVELNN